MEGVRSDRQLRRLGLIVLVVGLALSGMGVAAWVSLLPPGILISLLGVVLVVVDAAREVVS